MIYTTTVSTTDPLVLGPINPQYSFTYTIEHKELNLPNGNVIISTTLKGNE